MRFALIYEIPVPRPWEADSEHLAYKNVLEQAVTADRFGWDAVWTVGHHFLSEFSHCSNPEVLHARRARGVLLCLVNPYRVPHEAVVQTIELMGAHVIPEFSS